MKTMTRTPTPKKTRDTVLAEYNHRCAICGSDRPQIHHIDEDATNNDILNLLPLCPNCHLRDQHNPTSKVDLGKLKLFRRFRDPAILLPQFHPIYVRQAYLDEVVATEESMEPLVARGTELVEFIEELEMGAFYAKRITELLKRDDIASFWAIAGTDPEAEKRFKKDSLEYREKVVRNREAVQALLVEQLRYQRWAHAT